MARLRAEKRALARWGCHGSAWVAGAARLVWRNPGFSGLGPMNDGTVEGRENGANSYTTHPFRCKGIKI